MKNKLTIIGAILAIAVITALFAGRESKAQGQERKAGHQVVIFWDWPMSYTNGYAGSIVYCASSSSNAPKFPQWNYSAQYGGLFQVADAVAVLLDEGFVDAGTHQSGDGSTGRMFVK